MGEIRGSDGAKENESRAKRGNEGKFAVNNSHRIKDIWREKLTQRSQFSEIICWMEEGLYSPSAPKFGKDHRYHPGTRSKGNAARDLTNSVPVRRAC